MTNTPKRPIFYWGWISLLIGAVLAGISAFWVDPPVTNQAPNALPWEAKVNDQGELEVLGLTLKKSNSKDAMSLYGKEVQIFLFANQSGQAITLESFFEDMYIGYSLRGRLVLTLDLPQAQLDEMMNRGSRIKTIESGAREVSLASEDFSPALAFPIRALTYIPYPKLDEEALKSRFGEPVNDFIGDDGLRRWTYPDKQLIIIFDHSGRKTLQFGS